MDDASAKEPVGQPAGYQSADEAGDFKPNYEPDRKADTDVPGLGQERYAPVEDRITEGVNEKIREGEEPDIFIAEDGLPQEGLEINYGFRCRACDLSAWDFGKAD